MTCFDVFNGDADGLCALHQLRLEEPREALLVTGAKRDIALLKRVPARSGDVVTALDISAAANHDALVELLARGVRIRYFDHHFPGDLPDHPGLAATIDTSPGVCTGALVDRFLGGRQRIWAVVAAFGDDLAELAAELAASLALASDALERLRTLGEALAYNAYGDTESDLIVHPAALYRVLHRYTDPLRFLAEEPIAAELDAARRDDLRRAIAVAPALVLDHAQVHVLPDAAWSRRARGALANHLARAQPARAHAVLTPNASGGYTVSVRAPLDRRTGADAFCRTFATGGGREAAAGIDHLPRDAVADFAPRLDRAFS